MGMFDWASQSLDWLKNRWNTDWADFRKTFTESWAAVPAAFEGVGQGIIGMATAPFRDDADFWGSARMWADSALGAGGAILGGTVGTLFQAPILNEASWLLDKAYRYGVARPIATSFIHATNSAREAYAQGNFSLGDFVDPLLSFNNYRRAWNDSEYVTPGQAIVFMMGTGFNASFNGIPEATEWANRHDPRTPLGQKTFNSPESEGWLKYTSGTLDFAANLFADPAHGASSLYKAGKLRYVDKVATDNYVMTGKVQTEIGTPQYLKVKELALKTATEEEFGLRTMPDNPWRGQMQGILWKAARVSDAAYADAYLVTRAMDPEALRRLATTNPDLAADFQTMFARDTIADWDYQRGQLSAEKGADALRKDKFSAWIDATWAGDSQLARSLGTGVGSAMPKVRLSSRLRMGYHSFVLDSAPLIRGKFAKAVLGPVHRAAANLMPSQGWTAMLDMKDRTSYTARQLRANLERANVIGYDIISPKRINEIMSAYGSALSAQARWTIGVRAEDEIIRGVLEKFNISKEDLPQVVKEMNKWRVGLRRMEMYERYFISDEAARSAWRHEQMGQMDEARLQHMMGDEAYKAAQEGTAPISVLTMPDEDGRVHIVDAPDAPSTVADWRASVNQNEPILSSQFGPYLPMLDYRKMIDDLKMWQTLHPKPKFLPDPDDATKVVEVPVKSWQLGLAQLAKARGFYEASITALDAAMSAWKASTLLRPGQPVRNVASDWFLTLAEFGKLPWLMTAATGQVNVLRNFGKRGALKYEQVMDVLTARRANGTDVAKAKADIDGDEVPGNLDSTVVDGTYFNPGAAFAAGRISVDQYLADIDRALAVPAPGKKFGTPRPEERKGKSAIPQVFTSSATQALLREQQGAAFREPPPPPSKGLGSKGKRPSEMPGMADTPFMPTRVGAPFFVESWIRRQRDAGLLDEDEYRSKMVEHALAMNGRDKYRQRPWRLQLINEMINRHFGRRQAPDYGENPYGPGTVVVDPFTGLQPEVASSISKVLANFDLSDMATLTTRNVPKKRKGSLQSVYRLDAASQLSKFISHHADELLKPDTLLAMWVRPDGNIAVGYAKAKKETIEAGETIKAGASYRLKNFHTDEIRDSAHTGLEVTVAGGKTVRFEGGLSGAQGNEFQARISARDNPTTRFMSVVSDLDMEQMLDELGSMKPVKPRDTAYPAAWERAVNAQLPGDPVANLFMKGKSADEVAAEVLNSGWGHKYMRDMGFRKVAFRNHISHVEGMVNTHLPHPLDETLPPEKAAAARELRDKALANKATYDDYLKVVDIDDQPEIHGVTIEALQGSSRIWAASRKVVGQLQKVISDMPVDKLARFPAFAMSYKRHGTQLARIAGEYFKDADAIPAGIIDTMQEMAREKAYYDVRYRLYDTAQRNDFAYATRFLMPFSAAMMDSYIKYGRAFRQNPMLLVQGAYYWDTLSRNEMVQDENGYVMRKDGGSEKWYKVDPTTGEQTEVPEHLVGKHRYIQMQLPSDLARALGRKYYGVDAKPVLQINKDTLNVFLNTPSGGPLVAFPANEFALSNPEFGENAIVKKYLLPYGPTTQRSNTFLPSTIRSAWEAFNAEDGDTAAGHAAAIMQAELIGYGLGTRNEPPTFEEVREKAAALKWLRFGSTYLSPANFQLESPYQPYIDSYRQLVAANPQTAAEEFMRLHGDEFYAVTMSVTRNNTGLSATLESAEAYDKYKALIQQYPEFGGLIVGSEGAGAFAKSVYEQQKDTPISASDPRTIRELMPLADSVTELQKRTVWAKYSQMMDLTTAALVDRGIRTLRHRGAEDLLARRDAFIEANKYWIDPATGTRQLSPWYLDYQETNPGQVEKKFEALRTIAQDPKLQMRDDIRGLAEYLSLRTKMQREMSYWEFKTLNSQKAWGLKNKWDQQVQDLVESNPAFASLWNRWLSNDDSLDIPEVVTATEQRRAGQGGV